jgi:hypothetical protein
VRQAGACSTPALGLSLRKRSIEAPGAAGPEQESDMRIPMTAGLIAGLLAAGPLPAQENAAEAQEPP